MSWAVGESLAHVLDKEKRKKGKGAWASGLGFDGIQRNGEKEAEKNWVGPRMVSKPGLKIERESRVGKKDEAAGAWAGP